MANDGLTRREVDQFWSILGVKNPNLNFLQLFYRIYPTVGGNVYCPKFSDQEMSNISKTGNFSGLADEFWEARQRKDNNRCGQIFQTARSFIPNR